LEIEKVKIYLGEGANWVASTTLPKNGVVNRFTSTTLPKNGVVNRFTGATLPKNGVVNRFTRATLPKNGVVNRFVNELFHLFPTVSSPLQPLIPK
jgi:hypothetical protein